MSKRRARGLSAEERALWDKVVQTATPLPKRTPGLARKTSAPGTEAEQKPGRPSAPISGFRIGEAAKGSAGSAPLPMPETPLAMDKRLHGKLRRGKAAPEARIDLHGMTAADAHPALIGFILNARAQGKRLVLVITGKGRGGDDDAPVPARRGVLKQHLPHWLSSPPFRGAVLQVVGAHQRHGGSGAFYVYLRRTRD